MGGIEGDGPDQLLRSVVVVPGRRGAGVGRAIVAQLERLAVQAGAARLHMLTTTATEVFAAAGYKVADRSAAPPVIAVSREVASWCPSSATHLAKTLEP